MERLKMNRRVAKLLRTEAMNIALQQLRALEGGGVPDFEEIDFGEYLAWLATDIDEDADADAQFALKLEKLIDSFGVP